MIAIQNTAKDDFDPKLIINNIKNLNPLPILISNRTVSHSFKAGLNPIVDAASQLFAILSHLTESHSLTNEMQKEIALEMKAFQETIRDYDYHSEYKIICHYILCATFDDILAHNGKTDDALNTYSLLALFNQDTQHQKKFFTVMERAIKEPALFIDLMELMYICLSMGYKGQYRSPEQNQFQLEQVIHTLYQHIRAYRGSFSKSLSPLALKNLKAAEIAPAKNISVLFIFFVTACIIMTIFISLGYLMDAISNEAYKNVTQLKKSVSYESFKQ